MSRLSCLGLVASYIYVSIMTIGLDYIAIALSLASIYTCFSEQRACLSIACKDLGIGVNVCGLLIPLIFSLYLALHSDISYILLWSPLAIAIALMHTISWRKGTAVNTIRYTITLLFLTIPFSTRNALITIPLLNIIGIALGSDLISYKVSLGSSKKNSIFIIGGARYSDAIVLSTIIVNALIALSYKLHSLLF
ncbi:MAG TPA: DUF1614 domain-containing protein [Ignisphaera sp.]|nr:DUF1614 domain-containing protein [Ignisphaera sp.]